MDYFHGIRGYEEQKRSGTCYAAAYVEEPFKMIYVPLESVGTSTTEED